MKYEMKIENEATQSRINPIPMAQMEFISDKLVSGVTKVTGFETGTVSSFLRTQKLTTEKLLNNQVE